MERPLSGINFTSGSRTTSSWPDIESIARTGSSVNQEQQISH